MALSNFSIHNKVFLITGGSGSWGQELTKQLLDKYHPKEIRIYSRGEAKQVEMKRRFMDDRIKYVIGDVRDVLRLKQATRGVDVVYHLAALKHVPVCEDNPWETVLTNIQGVQNLIEASVENNVKRVVDVSTDKACDPLSIYGMSKAIGEKLIITANNLPGETQFVCIRAGNVLGTSGSVVPLFIEQIHMVNQVTITDESMSRFFIRLKDIVTMLLAASVQAFPGEIMVTKMPAFKIISLAKVMMKVLGDDKTSMRIIGIRPGEKLLEALVSNYEVKRTYEFGKYYVISPLVAIPKHEKAYLTRYSRLKNVTFDAYTSHNSEQLSELGIQTLLKDDGWIGSEVKKEEIGSLEKLRPEEIKNFAKSEGWVSKERKKRKT